VHNARVPAALALLLLLAADPPPPGKGQTPIGAEMQLMREIEAEEARLAKEKAAQAEGRSAPGPRPGAPAPSAPPREPIAPPPMPVWREPRTEPAPLGEDQLRVVAGVPLRWRRGDITPSTGTGIVYRKGSIPYPGLLLAAEIFPVRATDRLPPWLAPVGVGLSYSHGFLSTKVGDQRLGSSEQRAAMDLLYERRLLPGTRLGGRVGYGLHRFSVEDGSPGLTARRHGLRLGVDAIHALSSRFHVVGAARLFPWAGVSGPEADAHGSASGWGFELLAGVEGPIPFRHLGGLGWRIAYDVTRFSDHFDAAGGSLSRGGSGRALYHGLVLGLTFRR
jgi:hypothetical protein